MPQALVALTPAVLLLGDDLLEIDPKEWTWLVHSSSRSAVLVMAALAIRRLWHSFFFLGTRRPLLSIFVSRVSLSCEFTRVTGVHVFSRFLVFMFSCRKPHRGCSASLHDSLLFCDVSWMCVFTRLLPCLQAVYQRVVWAWKVHSNDKISDDEFLSWIATILSEFVSMCVTTNFFLQSTPTPPQPLTRFDSSFMLWSEQPHSCRARVYLV